MTVEEVASFVACEGFIRNTLTKKDYFYGGYDEITCRFILTPKYGDEDPTMASREDMYALYSFHTEWEGIYELLSRTPYVRDAIEAYHNRLHGYQHTRAAVLAAIEREARRNVKKA